MKRGSESPFSNFSDVLQDIKRDYNRSLIYGDLAIKTKPFDIKKTEAVARIGFTKYFN